MKKTKPFISLAKHKQRLGTQKKFSFYCSCFSVFFLFCLCLYFFYFAFCETQRKTSKMKANLQVIELFLFSALRLT